MQRVVGFTGLVKIPYLTSIYQSIYLPIYLSIYPVKRRGRPDGVNVVGVDGGGGHGLLLSTYLSIYLFIKLSIYLSFNLPIYLFCPGMWLTWWLRWLGWWRTSPPLPPPSTPAMTRTKNQEINTQSRNFKSIYSNRDPLNKTL